MKQIRISHQRLSLALWLAGALTIQGAAPKWVEQVAEWASPELKEINRRMVKIDQNLSELPVPAGTSSGERRGFKTQGTSEGEENWVELVFPEPVVLDRVVMVPLLVKGALGQIPGYGFPRRYLLEARDENDVTHHLLDERTEDFPNPGIYPVTAYCPPDLRIKKLRLIATETPVHDGAHVLALSELMALSGNMNLATLGKVSASSSREKWPTWSRTNLIDMETPLGLPVLPSPTATMAGWQSEATLSASDPKQVVVDLEQERKVDEVRIAPAWPGLQTALSQYGFPRKFIIEAATREDFSDGREIHDQTETPIRPGQNLMRFDLRGEPTRFIRMTATGLRERTGDYVFALGELQAYAGDENVALGAEVIAQESIEDEQWSRLGLTDGLAGGGKLIELPGWIRGLEKRLLLEEEHAILAARHSLLLEQTEKALVFGSVGATCGIAALAALYAWRSKRQRRIDRERHRERLARDLHDELGSNLGSIALISSFALEGESDPVQMRTDLAEIEVVARESADSMRDMVELLGGGQSGAASDWLVVMKGLAQRLLRGIELDCQLPVSPLPIVPDLETRREIYLFCKEVLYNTARHANSSNVRFHLMPSDDGLRVEIDDDGCGFNPETVNQGHGLGLGLGNLRERVAGLNGTMKLESSEGGPTLVRLDVPRGKRWRKPRDREQSK